MKYIIVVFFSRGGGRKSVEEREGKIGWKGELEEGRRGLEKRWGPGGSASGKGLEKRWVICREGVGERESPEPPAA